MSYGHFSEDEKEYIITRPDTPRPWVNYLFNDTYHAIVSQSGGGFSYCRDPKFNRIHRYERMITDRPGRYLFLHDTQSKDVWSANWQPMMKEYQKFETRHGLGYTIITSQYYDIQTSLTFLVPLKGDCELCIVEITNNSQKERQLKAFPYVDLIAGDAQFETDYPNILTLYARADFHPDLNGIIAYKQPHPVRQVESYTYFVTSEKITGYDCAKEDFVGRYGSLEHPATIIKGSCDKTAACGEDVIGVFEHDIKLQPGESTKFVLLTGLIDDDGLPPIPALQDGSEDFLPELPTAAGKEQIQQMIDTFLSEEKAEAELEKVKAYWTKTTTELTVQTPDKDFDRLTNLWGRYQLFGITYFRGTSAYHAVEGGLGYRDTAQDAEGIFALDVELGKRKLENLLRYQYSNGHAVSGFSEKEGSWELQGQAVVTGKSDVAVWLVYTVMAYLEETGDFDFLDKKYPYLDHGEATVYQHCLQSLKHLTTHIGKHGMPLIGKADWNDAYDRLGHKGRGETIWLAQATVRALRKMVELADFRGDKDLSAKLTADAEKMKANILKHGWDGNWFIAAINDDGYRVGSAENAQGKLPLNSQTWAILSEVVDQEKGNELADLIDRDLDTGYGPVLFSPVYTDYHPGIGRVTGFAPGTKENAAVFSHASAFKVVSDCFLKRGNAAYKTFSEIMPSNPHKSDPERYKVEPYILAEYVVGPGHPTRFGEGAFTWNTGTAPWMFMAATEWICGVRRTLKGLLIDPCVPEEWDEFKIVRPFRGASYNVSVKNPKHVQSGVASIKVDGKPIKGNVIEPHGDGKEHMVEVVMG